VEGDEQVAAQAIRLGAYEYMTKDPDGTYLENLPGILEHVVSEHDKTDEKRRVETALLASEERLRGIMENVSDAIVTIDESGTVESVNSAIKAVLGYETEEVLGRNVKMLMPEAIAAEHDGYLRSFLETGRGRFIRQGAREVVGRQKNGMLVPLDITINEMWLGGRRHFIGVIRDVSERKRTENALQSFMGRLRESNEELQNFASVASHDLQEPLRKIQAFGDRLEAINRGVDEEGAFYLFTTRLIPVFPFFVINLVFGLTNLRLSTFFWVSQIGMLPATVVFVNAGKELAQVETLAGILSPGLILSFALLGLFPIAARKALGYYRKRFGPPKG